MFWKTIFVIIAIAAFIYLGGGRLVIKAGNGIINIGHSMESLEKAAKDKTGDLIGYIRARGEKQVEKAIEKRRRLEEEPGR